MIEAGALVQLGTLDTLEELRAKLASSFVEEIQGSAADGRQRSR